MAKTMRILLLLSLVAVIGCRFAARQKTNLAHLVASSLVSPFSELQKNAPLTQSSFRNEVVTPKQDANPARAAVAKPQPEEVDVTVEPLVVAAMRIPENLPGVAKAAPRARLPYVMARYRLAAPIADPKAVAQLTVEARRAARETRVRIEKGHRCVIIVNPENADAPEPPVDLPIAEAIGETIDG